MSKTTIKWGILSTAQINRAVIGPIKDYSKSHLYAVASRDQKKADAYAKEQGFEKAYGSYEALLQDAAVDAVYISIPNGMHHEWIIKALEHGKHVLCEKSITTTEKDIRFIKQVAAQKGLLVMEGFMYRYHAFFQKILQICRSDKMGVIQNVQVSRCSWQRNPEDIRLQPGLGPGAMGDVGCYCLNFCRTIFNAEPKSWRAFVRYNDKDIDMETTASLAFAPQQTAQFFCSFTSDGSFASIIGANGRLTITEPFWVGTGDREFLYFAGNGHEAEHIRVSAEKTGHCLEIEDFTDAILEQRRPYLSLDDSIGNLRVMEDMVVNGIAI